MSDSNVPGLIAATALTGPELFYVVQAGNDRKVTATQIQAFSGTGLTIGTTAITGGTTGRLLYDNAGVVGEALLTYSAAQLQLGSADAASPVAQMLQAQSVVAGNSNVSGVNWTFIGSKGTGTGVGGNLLFQIAPPGSSGTTQNSLSTVLALNGVAFCPTMDFGSKVAGQITVARVDAPTNNLVGFGNDGSRIGYRTTSNGVFYFSASTTDCNNSLNTAFSSPGVATLQLGLIDSASPVAQTLQVQNVAAGNSNVNGANWTFNGSLSTGSGTSGDIIFQTGGTGAGATSQNALVTALTIKGATQQVIMATTPRISVAPTANSSASTTITNGADSSTNCGHRIQLNLNGTTYWIPCSSVAF